MCIAELRIREYQCQIYMLISYLVCAEDLYVVIIIIVNSIFMLSSVSKFKSVILIAGMSQFANYW